MAPRTIIKPFLLGALLVAARLPFYLTGHVQEDAFIAFRTARLLAQTGVYGFNAGERVSACTSHLYVFVLALLAKVSPAHFIGIGLVLNTVAMVAACYFVSVVVARERTVWLWAALALTPVALLASYAGMELAFVIFLMGLGLWTRSAWVGATVMFLLPWARPDAVMAGVILVGYAALRTGRAAWRWAAGLLLGAVSWAGFNVTYFGEVLNHSIVAKRVAFHPDRSLSGLLGGLGFIARRLALPVDSKFLFRFDWLFLVASVAAVAWLLWRARSSALVAVTGLVAVPVVGYAAGGIIFPWYLWPGQVLLSALLLRAAFEWAGARRMRLAMVGAATLTGMCVEWAWSYSTGIQESKYRAGVGRYVESISRPGDSLMLEPIGYIPYYAGRYTHDAIGMASPEVTRYREKFGGSWWIRYVRDFRPTYYVERAPLREGVTLDGVALNAEDVGWFRRSYELVKTFHYRAEDFTASRVGLAIAGRGTHDDFDVYRLR